MDQISSGSPGVPPIEHFTPLAFEEAGTVRDRVQVVNQMGENGPVLIVSSFRQAKQFVALVRGAGPGPVHLLEPTQGHADEPGDLIGPTGASRSSASLDVPSDGGGPELTTAAGVSLHEDRRAAVFGASEALLTPLEFALLRLLMREVGRVCDFDEIFRIVWRTNRGDAGQVHAVVKRLRAKVGRLHAPLVIEVVRGVGFRARATSDDQRSDQGEPRRAQDTEAPSSPRRSGPSGSREFPLRPDVQQGAVLPTPGVVVVIAPGDDELRRLIGDQRPDTIVLAARSVQEVTETIARLQANRDSRVGTRRFSIAEDDLMLAGAAGSVRLTPLEHGVLRLLWEHQGLPCAVEELSTRVWHSSHVGEGEQVRAVVKRLRRKIAQVQAPIRLEAVRRVGYKLTLTGTLPGLST